MTLKSLSWASDFCIYLTTGHLQLEILQAPETQNVQPWIFLLTSVVLWSINFFLLFGCTIHDPVIVIDSWLSSLTLLSLYTIYNFKSYNLHAKQILTLLSFFTITITIVLVYTFIIFHLDYPNSFLFCLPVARFTIFKTSLLTAI